jgi:galactokinase
MNCATRAYQYVPVKMDLHTFLVVNSMVKHTHLTSGYLDRVQECETALSYFQKLDQKIQSLSDVTLHQLEIAKGKLDQTAWKRASFIYSENKRVLSFQEAFEKGDYSGLGKHLNDCHKGLSEEYEVSCSELDLLQSIAVSLDGVKGARMMGGGFGGCTLNLVELDKVDEVSERIKQQYFDQLGIRAESYKLNIVDGVNEAF